MIMKSLLLAAAAAMALSTSAAVAQDRPDPDGYYSDSDHDGYYDRDGHYRHYDSTTDRRGEESDEDDSGPPPAVYREGEYERECRRGDVRAGTVFGAAGGGLIGGVASHGNPAAIVGGVLLGGLLGNTLSRDVDCDDQHVAFDVYADGLNGEVGHRYEWRHGDSYGYFTPTRDYTGDDGLHCRDFSTDTWRHGEEFRREGTACFGHDGYWHFR
jgi:surface antigen